MSDDANTTELKRAIWWSARGDVARSLRELRALASQHPKDPALPNAVGSLLAASGSLDDAIISFRSALELRAHHLTAQVNLGNALLERGDLKEALALLSEAVTHPNASAPAEVGLGRVLGLFGRHAEAGRAFERALTRKHAHAGTVSQRCYASLLDPERSARDIVDVHVQSVERLAQPTLPKSSANDRNPERKLRIAYVSADFREHSVACFLEGVLAAHDRSAVEIELFSDVMREDATSTRLYALADRVQRCVRLSHAELAAACEEARVDVLIDLAGHMQPNRLPVFLARPAPVQLAYLGYPGTTGARVFDARLTDCWADAEEAGPEPLAAIPGGYFAYSAPRDAPDVSPLAAAATGHVTFGCFADAVKLNPDVLRTWATLLSRSPRSRLLLKTRLMASADYREHVRSTLLAHGVDPERIELQPSNTTRREHLAEYARIDVALDTFPYAGATTSCEALWMGVPVVTLAGDHHAARLGVSVLSAAGLEHAIARDRDDYLDRALALTNDVAQLAQLRSSLRDRLRSSPLCDATRVARAIERAARLQFERWCRSADGACVPTVPTH